MGVATMANKKYTYLWRQGSINPWWCLRPVPLHSKQIEASFMPNSTACCAANSLRCLDLQIWQSLCPWRQRRWQWQNQCFIPCTYTLGDNTNIIQHTTVKSMCAHSYMVAGFVHLLVTRNRRLAKHKKQYVQTMSVPITMRSLTQGPT